MPAPMRVRWLPYGRHADDKRPCTLDMCLCGREQGQPGTDGRRGKLPLPEASLRGPLPQTEGGFSIGWGGRVAQEQ
jgi:hypothetical protein